MYNIEEHFTKEEIIERFTNPTFEFNDILDLIVHLNMHNFCPEDKMTIHEDHIEIYGLGGTEKLDEYPYFDDNYFNIYLPYMKNNKSVLEIGMVDYQEEIDVKERKQIIRVLKDKLSWMFNVNKLKFSLDEV